MEAVVKLEELVMDPDFAGAYDKGAKTEWLLEDMRLTGRNEGRIEGKIERNIEIAKNMLKDTQDYELISKYTGLDTNTLQKLSKEMK